MRYLLTFFAAVMIALPARVEVKAESASTDETARQEIESLIAGEDDAWNRGDATGFAARALPDVVFTNIVGMFSVGKPPFLAQHERIFSTIYKGSNCHQSIQHITLLKPDVAIVDTLAVVTGFQHTPPGIGTIDGAIHARLEQVLMRLKDGWWVASFHNVAVNPAAFQDAPPPPR
jgi:uncharacterized protein (TIGR02246 family)